MARIVLTCWGSHGDIDPFLGLGLALQARGHQATIATIEYYRSLIETSGLIFRPIRPNVDPSESSLIERIMDRSRGTDYLLRELLFPNVRAMFEDVSEAADGAELLISHPITFATPIVAAHRRIPWASVVLAPASLFSATDMMVLPPAPWLKSFERLGPWAGRLLMRAVRSVLEGWPTPVYELRQSLGLPRGANPILEGQHSPTLVLALYSRLLGAPQPDWPPNVVVTGHAFYDAPHGTSLAPELEAFLDSGPPPIVFTLGSSVVIIEKDFWRESVDAATRLGARAVLIAGEGLERVRSLITSNSAAHASDIIVVNRAPHSLLFPRASAVVHQCGVGTLAQSLRSGAPLLAVPYAHDQPDNAWRACHLGVARLVRAGRYRAPRVAAQLRTLTSDPAYAAAAKRVAAVVRSERGLDAACDAIEHTFALVS
ncbi:MAG: glycosyltransferase [Vicinamibacterales bacterium]